MSEDDNILDAEKEFEIISLQNEVEKLTNELIKYKILLNEIDSEANPDMVTDEEAICVIEIRKLKEASSSRKEPLTTDEAKRLDIFHKNLKLARGEGTRVGARNKAGSSSQAELEKLAKS